MICPNCGAIMSDLPERCRICGLPLFAADDDGDFSVVIYDVSDLFNDDDDDDYDDDADDISDADDARFYKLAGEVMSDKSLLDVKMPVALAWVLLAGVQLASRHPHISAAQSAMMVEAGSMLQAAISERHPDADELIEMGWNPKNDR